MISEDQIYRQLQQEIDKRTAIDFPKAESGADIRFLKHIFTPEEAKIAVHLSALPETPKRIHKRLKNYDIAISLEELENLLEGLFKKGAIMRNDQLFANSKNKKYALIQFAVGLYEFQLDKLNKEVAKDAEDYIHEELYKVFNKKGTGQIRTIPVEKALMPERYVGNYENIRQTINKKKGKISVMDCVCKQSLDLLEEPCKLGEIRNCCVTFDNLAELSLEGFPSAREVSKEELFELLEKWQKVGYVLQPENCIDPKFLCVCCGCCCGVLTGLKKFPKPAEVAITNYYAQVNPELCNGCETCLKRCQMDAIKMVNEKSTVDLDRCIGCGVCVPTCGMKAISLVRKDDASKPLAKSHFGMYVKIFMKKRGMFGAFKMILKHGFRKKV
jgi:electron transport complex protein RnfB